VIPSSDGSSHGAFNHDGGPHGVLLLHHFGGSPTSMRPWAEDLARRSYSVRVPLLAGHGTSWPELARTGWQRWYDDADRELHLLIDRCETVSVAGLSMGGGLALRLAERHPSEVAAVLLVNPSIATSNRMLTLLPILKRIVRSIPSTGSQVRKDGVDGGGYDRTPLRAVHSMTKLWTDVRAGLALIQQPLLLFRSAADGAEGELSSSLVLAGVRSAVRREVILENSLHLATLDNDAELIFERSADFLAEQVNPRRP
jgi:carboxylesterase